MKLENTAKKTHSKEPMPTVMTVFISTERQEISDSLGLKRRIREEIEMANR